MPRISAGFRVLLECFAKACVGFLRFKPTLNAFFNIYPIAAVCALHSVNFVSVYYLYNFVHFKYFLSYRAAGVLPAAVVVY